MAYENRKPKIQFADFCELMEIETINPDNLSDYDKEQGIKFQLAVQARPTVRLGKKTYNDIAHFMAKVASVDGLKVGDSLLVKGSHTEGSRWLSGATVRLIKK